MVQQDFASEMYLGPKLLSPFLIRQVYIQVRMEWLNSGVESWCPTIVVINKSALEFNLAFIVQPHVFFLKNVAKIYTTRTTATMPATVLPTMMARVSLNLMQFFLDLVKKGNGKGNCTSYLPLLWRHIISLWRVTPIIIQRGCRGRGRKKNEQAELVEGVHCPRPPGAVSDARASPFFFISTIQ